MHRALFLVGREQTHLRVRGRNSASCWRQDWPAARSSCEPLSKKAHDTHIFSADFLAFEITKMSVLRLYYTSPIRPLFTHKSCTLRPFPCEFGRFFFGINQHHRDPARSRKDRSERGRHHVKGTRYVGELGFLRFICPPLVSSRPYCDDTPTSLYAQDCPLSNDVGVS